MELLCRDHMEISNLMSGQIKNIVNQNMKGHGSILNNFLVFSIYPFKREKEDNKRLYQLEYQTHSINHINSDMDQGTFPLIPFLLFSLDSTWRIVLCSRV